MAARHPWEPPCHRSTPSAGEEPLRAGDVDGLTGGGEHDSFEVGLEEEFGDLEAVEDQAVEGFSDRAEQFAGRHDHGD